MQKIRIPNVFSIDLYELAKESPALINVYLKYEVSQDMKKFWGSLSGREHETMLNTSEKEPKDLREPLSRQSWMDSLNIRGISNEKLRNREHTEQDCYIS